MQDRRQVRAAPLVGGAGRAAHRPPTAGVSGGQHEGGLIRAEVVDELPPRVASSRGAASWAAERDVTVTRVSGAERRIQEQAARGRLPAGSLERVERFEAELESEDLHAVSCASETVVVSTRPPRSPGVPSSRFEAPGYAIASPMGRRAVSS